ncbi:replicative DNA helicase [Exiguobacterium sp. SH3S2]|uniref:replicative DNA helicase n=1 Tax=unclassified Exiguobacterium TaxID=2644629 RepID=UPI00103F4445|nr:MULTISPECIES: replicative DNA helicase [unclassified Exiguobacterium]TCI25984.1 replicative DNA helicase [Exiguobacterium sp. SH5S4]TCI47423.1 replicative DNA helicase [Exiguobacterium sp. SH3S3]TCI53896.1 replicative DNA helicase [Exiguobacterium sp. SH5S13]TCI60378.1 replicative DNA helicase [Exiguobacterium sp. SH3S1]TCI62570.1 replicative DNA helicase [Exiguobacterium sp. SH3S2]
MSDAIQVNTPPHSVEAEQAVLGAVILDSDRLITASERVDPDDFYRVSHQRIFEAMLKINDRGELVDLVTLSSELQSQGILDEIGGLNYLAEIAEAVPAIGNIGYYLNVVDQKAALRRLIRTATNIVSDGYERQDEVDAVLSDAERNILKVSQRKGQSSFHSIGSVLSDAYSTIEKLHQSSGEITGIATGFSDLDKMTAGFQRNDLIIVAARPSVGKTAFALNISQNVAVRTGENVAIFSLEMGAEQLVMRMLCAEGNIDAQRLRTGRLESEDWGRLSLAMSSLSQAGIFIDDTPGLRVNEIRAKCRRLKQEYGLGMIMIDYLQLIVGNGKPGENRQQEVSEISRTLKAIARELQVPVIALSQLSRGVESRQDKRPMMSDIRESGAIEQDADIVAFLYRDDYYDKESEDANTIEIIIAKQRNGPTGTVKLSFRKEYNKFVNMETQAFAPPM